MITIEFCNKGGKLVADADVISYVETILKDSSFGFVDVNLKISQEIVVMAFRHAIANGRLHHNMLIMTSKGNDAVRFDARGNQSHYLKIQDIALDMQTQIAFPSK
ncbi:MAG: hypothetical protein UX75_C0036G0008 [Candidatus Moranbacteria bacterium GW2011_GWE2_47_10]|nr:MAG: hypothetical protein UX75_C0036G0008 [Candidatus Moranbacteria bacterium GW2011_GWE2_47_10]